MLWSSLRNTTRETDWSRLPHHRVTDTSTRTITREEPCDYRDNAMERYYPVKTSDGRYDALYQQYRTLGEREPSMSFIGRCGRLPSESTRPLSAGLRRDVRL